MQCNVTVGLVGAVRRRSEDGDLDGAVRVDDVHEQGLVVVVVRVCGYGGSVVVVVRVRGYGDSDAEVGRTGGADVVVVQRLRRIERVAYHDTERSCITSLTYMQKHWTEITESFKTF